jgi:glycosyltransferase involved in cell wall biosynthesis
MRILMIAPQPFYLERGTPMNVKLLCRVLSEAGHRIDLLVFPTGQNVRIKNVRIIRLPNILNVKQIPVGPSFIKLSYDLVMTIAALWLSTTNKYDVIHGIEEGGFFAVILGKIFRKATIFDMDSFISDQLVYSGFVDNRFILNLVILTEKWCLGKSSCVITVCQALTEKAKCLNEKAKIFQIEDIPISDMQPKKDNIADLKKHYGLENTVNLVYTGNLESYQGIDLLLDAWKMFYSQIKNGRDYKLVIVGGTDYKINYYFKIVAADGIQDSICWVGQRPSKEMADWMEIGEALVSPRSDGENTPLKIYSYMSSGRPIVATRRKTHTQVLDDSIAFLADPDPFKFSHAISDALNKTEIAKQKAIRAREVVEKKYNYNVFKRKLLQAYATIS